MWKTQAHNLFKFDIKYNKMKHLFVICSNSFLHKHTGQIKGSISFTILNCRSHIQTILLVLNCIANLNFVPDAFYPPASEESRKVANLKRRKNPHTPITSSKKVCRFGCQSCFDWPHFACFCPKKPFLDK